MARIQRLFLIGGSGLVASVLFAGVAVIASQMMLSDARAALVAADNRRDADLIPILSLLPESGKRIEPVSILFVGDVMLDREVAARIRRAKNDRYPFVRVMDDARFAGADLQVMNLEGPVTDKRRPPEKTLDFMFDPRFVPVLKDVGFDGASQANNHSLDQGRIGADDSRSHLLDGGFITFGDEVRDDEIAISTTTVHGRRLAFVGFNSTSNAIDDKAAEATMKRARRSADTVIVFMHWGEEYRSRPLKKDEDRARWLIDHGADMVVGAHPHWVQSVSVYKGKPVFFSLGNFVFDQDWSVGTKQGLAIRANISDTAIAVDLYPVQITKSQPSFVEGAVREERLRELAAISDPSLTHQILEGSVSFPLH